MKFRRFISVLMISVFLIGTMVLAGGCGCGLLPSVGEMLGSVSDVVEEETAGDTESESDVESDEEEPDESEPDESESGEDSESDENKSEGEPELDIDNWYNPRTVSDLVDTFERFEWTWARISDGEEGDPHRVSYQIEGTEQVEGVDTTKIALTFEEDSVLLWLDDDEEVVRAQVNDDPVPEMALDTMLTPMFDAAFAPFVAVEKMDVEGLIQRTDDRGWDWRIIDKSTETIGEMQAEVTTMEVEIGAPWVDVDEGDEVHARWAIADFGEFQMLVEWNDGTGAAGEEYGVALEVENLSPR